MPTFQAIRDETTIEDAVYDVSPLADTFNPFGDFAVIKLDDRGGETFDAYARGTRVDIEIDGDDTTLTIQSGETVTTDAGTTDTYSIVNNAGTYENAGTVDATAGVVERFTGYVVERRESEQEGADALELEAYSFDQFLRRNTVTNDQRGNTITEALADIIDVDTPVTYTAANVDVGDDQELTRAYQGEAVENVLRDLAFKSNNEDFGVNDDLEFFFRQRETTHIDRGIDNTQWFRYDIPELGKEAINEVEVWFDDGEESVIVDDGTDKLDLQDSLNLPEPGTQRAELNRPLITDIGDAEDIGRKYLAFKNATLSGTVTTFGLYDAEPGDTIDVTIDPRGIDTEFVIAAIRYRWGVDETELTIVEKRGDVDDILSELSDSVQRVEMNGANRDAPKNRITTTNAAAIIDVSAEVTVADATTVESGETLTILSGELATSRTIENAGTVSNAGTYESTAGGGTMLDADRFVNDGRRAVRDTWTGDAPPDIDTIAVGTDGGGLSRSNDALRNQTASASATQTLPDATTVAFEATLTETGVEEVGLLAADGTLIARATFETAVDIDGTVTVTLGVSNDDSVSRGVLTADGQTAVRDVLADASPTLPNAYAYGDDGTAVAESDSALGNELVDVSLEEILIDSANTTAEWTDRIDIPDGTPAKTDSGALETTQTLNYRDGRNEDSSAGPSPAEQTSANYVDGTALLLSSDGQTVTYNLSWYDHAVPQSEVGIAMRMEVLDESEFEIRFNGGIIDSGNVLSSGLGWLDIEAGFFTSPGPGSNTDLEPGNTYQLEVETLSSDAVQEVVIDQIALYDRRYYPDVGDWDTEGWDSVDGNQQLSGPPLFPGGPLEFSVPTINTRRNITELDVVSDWNSTANEQYLEARIGGDSFTRENNNDTLSITGGPDSSADLRFGLSNSTTDATDTPTEGDANQSINFYDVTANPDAVVPDNISETLTRAIVAPDTLAAGTTLREAGLKSDSTLLTRHLLAEFDLLANQRLASAESTLVTSDN